MSSVNPNNPNLPLEFPAPWASDWGEDTMGLWMALEYKKVRYGFRWILPGEFMMGDQQGASDEKPIHKVILSQGFWLGETTVTQALWQAVMGDNPSHFKGKERPVDSVSWNNVQNFIETLQQTQPNLQACLPTEAQWEYACRAGTNTRYYFGDEITHEQAHWGQTSRWAKTVNVKAKPANAWELYQMHGNVWEWCADRYDEHYYQSSPELDPSGPSDSSIEKRVLRGGSWRDDANYLRSAARYWYIPVDYWHYDTGFRLALG